eukprot:scaffold52590_cov23-Cyclotella_meneghiniana.AAC.1
MITIYHAVRIVRFSGDNQSIRNDCGVDECSTVGEIHLLNWIETLRHGANVANAKSIHVRVQNGQILCGVDSSSLDIPTRSTIAM